MAHPLLNPTPKNKLQEFGYVINAIEWHNEEASEFIVENCLLEIVLGAEQYDTEITITKHLALFSYDIGHTDYRFGNQQPIESAMIYKQTTQPYFETIKEARTEAIQVFCAAMIEFHNKTQPNPNRKDEMMIIKKRWIIFYEVAIGYLIDRGEKRFVSMTSEADTQDEAREETQKLIANKYNESILQNVDDDGNPNYEPAEIAKLSDMEYVASFFVECKGGYNECMMESGDCVGSAILGHLEVIIHKPIEMEG